MESYIVLYQRTLGTGGNLKRNRARNLISDREYLIAFDSELELCLQKIKKGNQFKWK